MMLSLRQYIPGYFWHQASSYKSKCIRMILIWPSSFIVQIVPDHCISRLKLIFKMETLKIFLSETTRPRALIFGMKHLSSGPQPSLFKLCPWDQKCPCPRGPMFYIGSMYSYRENLKKSSCKTRRPRALIFGM